MAAQLRAKIYGPSRANFSPGFPSKCEAMQHYIWCLEEQYKVNTRLNDTMKKTVRDRFVANLRTHWSNNQSTPKPTLDPVDVNKIVKPLIDFYFGLKDHTKKLEDQSWIDSQKEKLQPLLDIEKKPVTKKRSIQEVRNYQDSKVCQIVDVKQKFVLSSKIISSTK